MITLEDAGYLFRIENSGKVFQLLIRCEDDFIKFFLRWEHAAYWVECLSAYKYNDFTAMIGVSELNWYNPDHIQKLAEYYDDKQLERDADFISDLTRKLEDVAELMEG